VAFSCFAILDLDQVYTRERFWKGVSQEFTHRLTPIVSFAPGSHKWRAFPVRSHHKHAALSLTGLSVNLSHFD
jgi:hypothetical protein